MAFCPGPVRVHAGQVDWSVSGPPVAIQYIDDILIILKILHPLVLCVPRYLIQQLFFSLVLNRKMVDTGVISLKTFECVTGRKKVFNQLS